MRYKNPKGCWSKISESRKSALVLGSSAMGKTLLIERAMKEYGGTFFILNPEKARGELLRFKDLGARVLQTFDKKSVDAKYFKYTEGVLRKRMLVIEDLAHFFGKGSAELKMEYIINATVRPRYGVICTAHFIKGRVRSVITNFKLIVFFKLIDKSNLAKLFQGRQSYQRIALKIDELKPFEYFIVDRLSNRMSSTYSNKNPLPLLSALKNGVQDGEMLINESLVKRRITHDLLLPKLIALLQKNPKLTYAQLAKICHTTPGSISGTIYYARLKGSLPNTHKKTWTRQSLEKFK